MSQNREVAKRVNIVRVKMVREASLIGTANAEDYDDLTPDSAFRSR